MNQNGETRFTSVDRFQRRKMDVYHGLQAGGTKRINSVRNSMSEDPLAWTKRPSRRPSIVENVVMGETVYSGGGGHGPGGDVSRASRLHRQTACGPIIHIEDQ